MRMILAIAALLFHQSAVAVKLSSLVDEKVPTVIAVKSEGKLVVYRPETHSTMINPALFGKMISDEYDKVAYDIGRSKPVTPAGTFVIEKAYSTKMHEPIIMFIHGKKQVVAIHPLYLGKPGEKRAERLASESVEDNRVTNGCINVSADFFNMALISLPQKAKMIVLKENEHLDNDIEFNNLKVVGDTNDDGTGQFFQPR
ncbi:MAG: hypothetical protein QXN55_00570 [Candidatus Nitrosotenuis sp.]